MNNLQYQVSSPIFLFFWRMLWLLSILVDVFKALSLEVPLGVVPQENSIFGGVIETYDFLKIPGAAFIRGEIILKVEHCLLARKGVQHNDIRRVLSHEQVCLLWMYESHTTWAWVIVGSRSMSWFHQPKFSISDPGENSFHGRSGSSVAWQSSWLCSYMFCCLCYTIRWAWSLVHRHTKPTRYDDQLLDNIDC